MAAAKQVAVSAVLVLALLVSLPAWTNQGAESSSVVEPPLQIAVLWWDLCDVADLL